MSEGDNKETTKVKLEYIKRDIEDIKTSVHDIRTILRQDYVTKEQFEKELHFIKERYDLPRNILFSLMGLISVSFVTAIAVLIGWK